MAINFIITLSLSFLIILMALLVFHYIRPPVYRVEAINVKCLLASVLNGTATTADWDVFLSMPIRQDPELDQIRHKCAMLATSEMSERQGLIVFTEIGRMEISSLLEQLNQKIQASDSSHDR